MISALLTILIIAVIVALVVWLLRYLQSPKPFEIIVIVVGVLIAIVCLLDALGWYDGGLRVHLYP